jgi:hypothetical protein
MSADPNRIERRGAQRFQVHLPLSVHFDGQTAPGFTQTLSGRGVFFYSEIALPEGAVVELAFSMPGEITLAENMPVRCRGRVLRASTSQAAHSTSGQRNGIAVQFDSYEYLPADEPVTQFVRVSTASVAAVSSGLAPR